MRATRTVTMCTAALLGLMVISTSPAQADQANSRLARIASAPALDRMTQAVIRTEGEGRWSRLSGRISARGPSTSSTGVVASPQGIPVAAGPQGVVLDPGTRTGYVSTDAGVVSVVDLRGCDSAVPRCGRTIASVAVGPDSAGMDLNLRTETLYVDSPSAGTVSVVDTRSCRAGNTSGCSSAHRVVTVAGVPLGISVNPRTNTVYVGDLFDHISVIDGRTCRGSDVLGCSGPEATIPGSGPLGPVVDPATNTIYVPEAGPGQDNSADTVLVVDGRHCQASDVSGCSVPMPRTKAGPGATNGILDSSSHTFYVANAGDNSLSAIDVTHCRAGDESGCAQVPGTIPVGAEPLGGLALDPAARTLFIGNTNSDTLSVLDTSTCRAPRVTACPSTPPPTLRTGTTPFWLAFDKATRTLFSTNHNDNALGVLDARRCNASHLTGCRHLLPNFASTTNFEAVDPAVHTWYGLDFFSDDLHLVDTRKCNAHNVGDCASSTRTSTHPSGAGVIAVNPSTHTIYVSADDSHTVAILDANTCNAVVAHPDCSEVAPRVHLTNSAALFAVNESTDTLYVSTQADGALEVVDGATCNATTQTGCGATPAVVPLGGQPFGLTVDATTDTVYVADFGENGSGHSVNVIDARHCEAGDTTGCAQTPAQIPVGESPIAVRTDPGTHTLYVANNRQGELPGTVTVIDTTRCRAADSSGCQSPVTTVTDVGRGLFDLGIDPTSHQVFASSLSHASVSQIDGRRCNARVTSGCHAADVATDDVSADLTFDPVSHTMFMLQGLHADVTLIDTTRRR
jgi:DNA-binding beta-propeller fold protein YncE